MKEIMEYLPLIMAAASIFLAWGQIKGEIKALKIAVEDLRRDVKEDIGRLEKKQDRYNNLQERIARVENSTSYLHKRISELHFGGGRHND